MGFLSDLIDTINPFDATKDLADTTVDSIVNSVTDPGFDTFGDSVGDPLGDILNSLGISGVGGDAKDVRDSVLGPIQDAIPGDIRKTLPNEFEGLKGLAALAALIATFGGSSALNFGGSLAGGAGSGGASSAGFDIGAISGSGTGGTPGFLSAGGEGEASNLPAVTEAINNARSAQAAAPAAAPASREDLPVASRGLFDSIADVVSKPFQEAGKVVGIEGVGGGLKDIRDSVLGPIESAIPSELKNLLPNELEGLPGIAALAALFFGGPAIAGSEGGGLFGGLGELGSSIGGGIGDLFGLGEVGATLGGGGTGLAGGGGGGLASLAAPELLSVTKVPSAAGGGGGFFGSIGDFLSSTGGGTIAAATVASLGALGNTLLAQGVQEEQLELQRDQLEALIVQREKENARADETLALQKQKLQIDLSIAAIQAAKAAAPNASAEVAARQNLINQAGSDTANTIAALNAVAGNVSAALR